MISKSELAELMQQSASDAVQYAAAEHLLTLDFSLDSIRHVDHILYSSHLRHQLKKFSNEHLFTLSSLFAAYLGQIFIDRIGGCWVQLRTEDGAPHLGIEYMDKEYPLTSLCYHKIVHNAELSLEKYLQQALHNHTQ